MLELSTTSFLYLLFPLLIAYLFLFRQKAKASNSSAQDGKVAPSPPALPIIGHAHLAGKYLSSPKSHEYLLEMHEKYGPVVELNIAPGAKIIFVSDGDFIRRAWVSPDFCRNEVMQILGSDFMGSALSFIPTGPVWRRHRKMMLPSFFPANLRYATKTFQDALDPLLDAWREKLVLNANEKEIEVDLSGGLKAALLDAIGTTLYSTQFEAVNSFLDNRECEAVQPLWDILSVLQKRVGYPPFLWFLNGSSPSGKMATNARVKIRSFIGDIVDKKKTRLESQSSDQKSSETYLDIVDRMILQNDNGDRLTDQEIIEEALGLFLASFENVFRTTEATFLEILSRPEVLDRVLEELATVLPVSQGETAASLTMADLDKFVYVENVIKEAMRFQPTVGWIPRASAKDVEVNGYKYPKNSLFMLDLVAANKDSKYWKNPEQFNPDRFLNPEECPTFIPFGDGPTNCIGQKLAWIQMKLFIIQLFSKFEMKLAPGQTFERVTSLTTGLKDPLRVHLSKTVLTSAA